MKKLLPILLLIPVSGWAAPALVGCQTQAWSAGATITKTYTGAVTGNLIWAYVFDQGDSNTLITSGTTLSDATNGSYTHLDGQNSIVSSKANVLDDFYHANITGGSLAFTATLTATPTTPANAFLVICEFSGLAKVSPLDAHSSGIQVTPATANNNITAASVTPTVSGDAVMAIFLSGSTSTDNLSLSQTPNEAAVNFCGNNNCDAWLTQGAPAPIVITATASAENSINSYYNASVAFKQAFTANVGSLMLLGIGQ